MESIINSLYQYGALGVIAGALLWNTLRIQGKLFKVIEDNTQALTKLTVLIDNLCDKK